MNDFSKLLRTKYGISEPVCPIETPYELLMKNVADQVSNFEHTDYEPDGRNPAELAFEATLSFTQQSTISQSSFNFQASSMPSNATVSGFMFPITVNTKIPNGKGEFSSVTTVSEPHLDIILNILFYICSAARGVKKILPRKKDEKMSGHKGKVATNMSKMECRKSRLRKLLKKKLGEDFRGERRIVRLILASYWLDEMLKAFEIDQKIE
mmetsp:Transcript_15574/g.35034  ORF Transcript_15574/g.35034 Transcript_15574/m.35034 type:complete len:210 (-) Transcript_15574:340-969(-)